MKSRQVALVLVLSTAVLGAGCSKKNSATSTSSAARVLPAQGRNHAPDYKTQQGVPAPVTAPHANSSQMEGVSAQTTQAEGKVCSVTGEVYLAMESGDVKRIADTDIQVLRDVDRFQQLRARSFSDYRQAPGFGTDAVWEQHAAQVDAAIKEYSVASTTTDSSGKFSLDGLVPGDYLIHSRCTMSGNHYYWFLPVTVKEGDNRVSLANRNVCNTPWGGVGGG